MGPKAVRNKELLHELKTVSGRTDSDFLSCRKRVGEMFFLPFPADFFAWRKTIHHIDGGLIAGDGIKAH